MAFAYVNSGKYSGGVNGGTSGAVNAGTAPNLITVWVGYQSAATLALSDSGGHTWTRKNPVNQVPNISAKYLACFYTYGTLGNCSAITFALNGTAIYAALAWHSYTASISTDPFVQQVDAAQDFGGGGATHLAAGSITPAAGSLLSTGFWAYTDNSASALCSSPFIHEQGADYVGTVVSYPVAAADFITTDTTARNPDWTIGGIPGAEQYMQAMVVEFQETGGGGGGGAAVPVFMNQYRQRRA